MGMHKTNTNRKILIGMITILLPFFVIELALTIIIYHWYKDRSESALLNEPLAILAAFKLIDNRFHLFNFSSSGDKIYKTNIPKYFLPELKELNAGFGNSNNPTRLTTDTKPLTKPNAEFGYVLRPGAKVRNFLLNPSNYPNLDPGILGYPADSQMSSALQLVVDKEKLVLQYVYTINENGERLTLPIINSDKKIVVVGDSVAFGVGVEDSYTAPSQLQKMVGTGTQVVNLAVGGYQPEQIYDVAVASEYADKNNVLIYLICENDFKEVGTFDKEKFRDYLHKFYNLKVEGKYSNVLFVFNSYVYRNFPEIVGTKGYWKNSRSDFEEARVIFSKFTDNMNIAGVDWSSYIEQGRRDRRSMYAGLEFYFDHVHMSPEGNRIIAELMFSLLSQYDTVKN